MHPFAADPQRRYLYTIHTHKDAANNWEWPLQDGLGSVREVVDNTVAVLESRNYDPYGTSFGNTGTSQTNYGFTGELDGGNVLPGFTLAVSEVFGE